MSIVSMDVARFRAGEISDRYEPDEPDLLTPPITGGKVRNADGVLVDHIFAEPTTSAWRAMALLQAAQKELLNQ